jgi:hypothetical protein
LPPESNKLGDYNLVPTIYIQDKVQELKDQVAGLQPAPLSGYNTIQNDERRTVEILHRNELEKVDNERRTQYDKLVHDFLVRRRRY